MYYFALDRDYYTLYILAGLICIQLVVLPTAFLWEHLKKLLPVAGAWSAFRATRGAEALKVCEQVRDADGTTFAAVPDWFFNAIFGRTAGPWWIVTVAE